MVLKCSTEPVWTESPHITAETVSEYVLVSNPTQIEMSASSVYGTLPRGPRCHRRGMSEASVPAKYATMLSKSDKPGKKSFFAGIANKIRYAVDGKASNQLHRRLQWSPSEECTSSTGSLHRDYSPVAERKNQDRPHRLWTRGLESMYASQRKLSSWKKPNPKKFSSKENVLSEFGSCTSDCSSSSAPSSPESQRSFLSANAKRSRRNARDGYNSRSTLQHVPSRESFTTQAFQTEDSKKSSGCKLLVVGAEGVGKSALTVRFLTKRFIGEYAPEIESVYDQTVNIEGKDVNVHLWDSAIPDIYQNSDDDVNSDTSTLSHSSSLMSVTSSGGSSCRLSNRFSNSSLEDESQSNNNKVWNQDTNSTMSRTNKLRQTINKKIRRWRSSEGSESEEESRTTSETTEAERRLRWADGIVVVYSICDQSSFEAARDIIRFVRQTEAAEICRQGSNIDFSATRIPIMLVGNKLDLEHRRRVSHSDARNLAASFACSFNELSVSESFEPVSEVIRDHLKTVRKSAKHREAFKSKSKKGKW